MAGSKRSRSFAASPPSSSPEAELSAHFSSHGWCAVRGFLSRDELRYLRHESSALYASAGGPNTEAVAAVVRQGCVLDVLAQCPMRDDDPARVDAHAYLQARAKQLESATRSSSSMATDVLTRLLFQRLPALVGPLLASSFPGTDTHLEPMFFNEHYVVKPPQSHVEFRWHRDDDEQLGMCLHREHVPPYASAWCALDDVTASNGALRFVSLSCQSASSTTPSSSLESIKSLESRASEPLLARAGDVLVFLSNVWHCSASNESTAPRRAFYAQYSRCKITSGPRDASPLSFAIPCGSSACSSSAKHDKDAATSAKKRRLKPRSSES